VSCELIFLGSVTKPVTLSQRTLLLLKLLPSKMGTFLDISAMRNF
jgi:hypothetical protein